MDTPEDLHRDTLIRDRPQLADFDEQTWEKTVNRDVLVGAKVGEYEIRRRVGAGGMGIVYEGYQPVIGRRVAIKLLRPNIGTGSLVQEARAANVVRHRGIVDVYGFGETSFGQYLVMEFLEGSPLDALLAEQKKLSPEQTIRLLDELLAPLEAAHRKGLVHRDLKPSNLFLVSESGGEQYVKMLDFGLAKQTSVGAEMTHMTKVSAVVGTPHYMAPEQARGQSVGPKADLYSVGCIAFELLTGRVPFEGDNAIAVMLQQVNDPPPRPSRYADVSPALEKLIMQLLEKDPGRRPESAGATRASLKQIGRDLARARTALIPRQTAASAKDASREGDLENTTTQPLAQTDEFRVPAPRSTVKDLPPAGKRLNRRLPALVVVAIGAAILGGVLIATSSSPTKPGSPTVVGSPTVNAVVRESPAEKPEDDAVVIRPVESAVEQRAEELADPRPIGEPIAKPVEKIDVKRVETPVEKPGANATKKPPAREERATQKPVGSGAMATLRVGLTGGQRADVFVRGKRVGTTPLFNHSVAAGSFKLKLHHPNGSTYETTVVAKPGQLVEVARTWDPIAEKIR